VSVCQRVNLGSGVGDGGSGAEVEVFFGRRFGGPVIRVGGKLNFSSLFWVTGSG